MLYLESLNKKACGCKINMTTDKFTINGGCDVYYLLIKIEHKNQ